MSLLEKMLSLKSYMKHADNINFRSSKFKPYVLSTLAILHLVVAVIY